MTARKVSKRDAIEAIKANQGNVPASKRRSAKSPDLSEFAGKPKTHGTSKGSTATSSKNDGSSVKPVATSKVTPVEKKPCRNRKGRSRDDDDDDEDDSSEAVPTLDADGSDDEQKKKKQKVNKSAKEEDSASSSASTADGGSNADGSGDEDSGDVGSSQGSGGGSSSSGSSSGSDSAEEPGAGFEQCTECFEDLKPGQKRYRTKKCHKPCGLAVRSIINHLKAKSPALLKKFKDLKKTDPMSYAKGIKKMRKSDLAKCKGRRTEDQIQSMVNIIQTVCRVTTMSRDSGSMLLSKGEYIMHMKNTKGMKKAKARKQWKIDKRTKYTEIEHGELKVAVKKPTELTKRDGVEHRRGKTYGGGGGGGGWGSGGKLNDKGDGKLTMSKLEFESLTDGLKGFSHLSHKAGDALSNMLGNGTDLVVHKPRGSAEAVSSSDVSASGEEEDKGAEADVDSTDDDSSVDAETEQALKKAKKESREEHAKRGATRMPNRSI